MDWQVHWEIQGNITPGQVRTRTALCRSMYCIVRSQDMLLLTLVVARPLLCECHITYWNICREFAHRKLD